jgi:hypothetical protein
VEGVSEKVDPSGILRHRLLYEGCGHQPRAVGWDEANTHYVIYWWINTRQPPVVYLHLRKAIIPLGEVTRPNSIDVVSTVHKNALTGETIVLP